MRGEDCKLDAREFFAKDSPDTVLTLFLEVIIHLTAFNLFEAITVVVDCTGPFRAVR